MTQGPHAGKLLTVYLLQDLKALEIICNKFLRESMILGGIHYCQDRGGYKDLIMATYLRANHRLGTEIGSCSAPFVSAASSPCGSGKDKAFKTDGNWREGERTTSGAQIHRSTRRFMQGLGMWLGDRQQGGTPL